MAKIYISATRLDLSGECEAVKRHIENIGHTPVDSYGPSGLPILESCLADVDGCDVYLLILGHAYGERPAANNPDHLSYTQLEFRRAMNKDMRRIVLRRSGVADERRSDIYESGQMAALQAFQQEVEAHARPAWFADENELIAQLRAGLDDVLSALGLQPAPAALGDPLRRASRDLLSWRRTLPGDVWLERSELAILRERMATQDHSLTLLLGEPGCGKSALLARLGADVQDEGIPVLAIKADLLPAELLSPQTLADHLGLAQPVLATVLALAAHGAVLVLIDQLDALADLVVQHSSRLRVLLNLIRDLDGIGNVHVVASCRVFEHRHDPSLRNLESEVLTLALPSWSAVAAVLEQRGIQAGGWNEGIRETLRSPHALDLFLSELSGEDEASLANGFQGLLEKLWEKVVLQAADCVQRRALLMEIAQRMAEDETLWLAAARFEDRFSLLRDLEAAGLLIRDANAGRIGFRHQTLYEFIRARSFLDQAGSLTANVVNQQASLRIRPQLWYALTYLRRVDDRRYQDELQRLWAADMRRHLRMLVIEFLGMQTAPLPTERQLAFNNFADPWFQRRFLAVVPGSPGWFDALRLSQLPNLMARPLSDMPEVSPLLERALLFAPEAVLNLLDRHWLPHSEKDTLTWRLLARGPQAPRDVAWIDRLERIVARTGLNEWEMRDGVNAVSAALPDEAPRLVAAWYGYRWRSSPASGDGHVDADEVLASRQKLATKLLETRDWYELPAIAEAAPGRFIAAIWPVFCELLENITGDAHAFVVGYREATMLIDDLEGSQESHLQRPLSASLGQAITLWAAAEPDAFLSFLDSNGGRDAMLVQRLLAKGLVAIADVRPNAGLEFLCADSRRLVLGPFTDKHRNSRQLIQAVSPHVDDTQFARLERAIVAWSHYHADPQDDASVRHQRLHWNRQHRLRLLRALPRERLSPPTLRLVMEEERAFPGLDDVDVRFTGFREVVSPVSAEQMERADDEQVISLFEELTDEHQWDHPRHRMRGGAIQAGRELARLAENDPERAARLMLRLSPSRNEGPVSEVLQRLAKSEYDRHGLYQLIRDLQGLGHDGNEFRNACAWAIAAAVNADHPVPEDLFERLASWLVPVSGSEDEVENTESTSERQESLLWRSSGIHNVPSGNYPVLNTLSKACLENRPAMIDRWMALLESHLQRTETPKVWAEMACQWLPQLQHADRNRAQAFLDGLFSRHRSVLATIHGIDLMGYLQHWISPGNAERWLDSMAQAGGDGPQGYGELLMLRHALFPQEDWVGARMVDCLASTDVATRRQRIGVAHAAVHLWSEPDHRSLAHRYLLPLLATPEVEVRHAVAGIFLSTAFVADSETQAVFDTLCEHPGILREQPAHYLTEHLEKLVEHDPVRVARLSNVLLDQVGEDMTSFATSWYLSAEPLIAVALALQDMPEPQRTAGVALFERMLEYNLPQARELTFSLDKRTPNTGTNRPARRRRRSGR